jgi:hypothetical protein
MAFDFPSSPTVDQVYTDFGVSYVWNGYGWMMIKSGSGGGGPGTPGDYVLKTGDTMSGPLTLPANPTAPLQAATKAYVDQITQSLPTGPVGTALVVGTTRQAGFGNPIESGNY